MKLELKRKEFLEVLGQVQHITERRAHQPILSFVLIKADEKNQLTLLATDLEVFVKAKSKCEKSSNLEIALPAKELYELVKEIDSEKIEVEVKNGTTELRTKSGKYFIHSLPSSQFPYPPEGEFFSIASMSSATLYELFEKTAFAASSDESRYVLTGVLVEISKSEIRLIASDGHRLATYSVENENSQETKFIIPKNAVSDLKKILPSQKIVEIKQNEGVVLISSPDISIWIKTISEEYPNWRAVFPKDEEVSRCIVKSQEFKKALKRVGIFASSKFPYVILEVDKGKVILRAESDELGSSEEEIDADTYGEEKIALSLKFLQDAISSIDSPLVSIKIFGQTSPCLIQPVGGKGAENLIMPIKL
jgi:DNA polymerase-3 subunit beta